MPSTTNFGWTTPADTDLVKDGAAAIRTLGNGIDTSFVDLKGGTTGQVLSKNSNTDLDFTWVAQDDSNAIQNAIVDAKGDLISATAADTPARLAVGTDGQYLQADSTTATGLKWATVSAGGMTTIASGSLSGTALNITSIPTTHKNLQLVIRDFKTNTDGDTLRMRLQNDSNGNYARPSSFSATNQALVQTSIVIGDSQDDTVTDNIIIIDLLDYANTTSWKPMRILSFANNETTSTNYNVVNAPALYNQTGAITEINLFPQTSGATMSGTYILYGVS